MKIWRNIFIFILLIVGISSYRIATIAMPQIPPVSRYNDWATQAVGGTHIHTSASHDSNGSLEKLTEVADDLNFSFLIITDHNKFAPDGPFYQDRVLLVPASELSTATGHLLMFGVDRTLTKDERNDNPIEKIKSMGGWSVAAHPTKMSRPWQGGFKDVDGVEVASSSAQAENLLRTAPHTYFIIALAALLNPPVASSYITYKDNMAFEFLDNQLRNRSLVGMCGIDAHDRFGYARELLTYHTIVISDWHKQEYEHLAAEQLLHDMRAGKFYCRVGYIGDLRLNFVAHTIDNKKINLGEHTGESQTTYLETVVYAGDMEVEIRLYRNGQVVAVSNGDHLTYEKPTVGNYRVEVWGKISGFWGDTLSMLAFSNALYVDHD